MIGDRPVLSQNIVARGVRKSLRLLTGKPWDWEITQGYMTAFQRFRPEIVLAQYGPTGVRVMDACQRMKIPLVVHFRGFDASVDEVIDRLREPYLRLFENAAALVAVSRSIKSKLVSLGARPGKIVWNPSGVDCDAFSAAAPAESGPVFLSAGRFAEKKAPYLTLLAFSLVVRQRPDARMRMIGGGTLLGPCRQIAASLGLNSSVEFLGQLPHAAVQEEMRKSRAFVQHSIRASNGDCEGTPVAVMEAGASGLPVVATRHAGIPDVVIEEETGLLVDEGDVDSMAKQMIRLIDDPQLAGRLGCKARSHIERNFSMQKSTGRLWNVVKRCLAEGTVTDGDALSANPAHLV
jgi:glycosyltransferase involved in cell wall biosynthesis